MPKNSNVIIDQKLMKAAIKKWGKKVQKHKLQEELLELSLALNQIHCPTKNKEKLEDEIYGELADVKIMMTQAELLFDKDRINKKVEEKLKKLKNKIESK